MPQCWLLKGCLAFSTCTKHDGEARGQLNVSCLIGHERASIAGVQCASVGRGFTLMCWCHVCPAYWEARAIFYYGLFSRLPRFPSEAFHSPWRPSLSGYGPGGFVFFRLALVLAPFREWVLAFVSSWADTSQLMFSYVLPGDQVVYSILGYTRFLCYELCLFG